MLIQADVFGDEKYKPNKALHSTPATRGFSMDAASVAPEELARLLLAHPGGGSE
jgi:hypothetical protein